MNLGYLSVDAQNPDVHIVNRDKTKRISEQDREQLKRRRALAPIIATQRPITAWITVTSRAKQATDCMR